MGTNEFGYEDVWLRNLLQPRRMHLFRGFVNNWARSYAEAVERDLLVAYPVINIRVKTNMFVATISSLTNKIMQL